MVADRTGEITALRGHAITFTGDPFVVADAFLEIPDALIVAVDGIVTVFGPYQDLAGEVPPGVAVQHYSDHVMCAGFVDAHTHYVQIGMVGAFGAQLLDWLNRYTFVEEQRFVDRDYARSVAVEYFDEILRNGTTTAAAFCATYPASVDAFFEESVRRGTRMIAGKVLMDRNAPEPLLDTSVDGCADSADLIARWHGVGRQSYAVTPRFAPTSSPTQLRAAGELWAAHPGTYLHTHVAESATEGDWVHDLFPERAGYLDVYDHYGLLGPRALLAHGVHLSSAEVARISETGTSVVHCPTSNLFLGSGLFSMRAMQDGDHRVRVGLGTDVGAGTSLSMLATMNEAYKVSTTQGFPLSAVHLFYLATLGGAVALDLSDRIGSIAVGKEADIVVLDPRATPLLASRTARAKSIDEVLFVLAMLGDDRAVAATYVAGRLAHERAVAATYVAGRLAHERAVC